MPTLAEKIEAVAEQSMQALGVAFSSRRDYKLAVEQARVACRRAANLAIEFCANHVSDNLASPVEGVRMARQLRALSIEENVK